MVVTLGMFVTGCGRISFDPVAIDAPRPPTSQADCPPGYTFMVSSCYVYEGSITTDWLGAERNCEAVGAHLVVVDDVAEAGIVDGVPPGTVFNHWYGASDRVTPGVFLTVTDVPLVPSFDAGEPMAGLHCLELLDSRNLKSADCGLLDNYVCELDGLSVADGNF
jgi:hypothetical protein